LNLKYFADGKVLSAELNWKRVVWSHFKDKTEIRWKNLCMEGNKLWNYVGT